MTGDISHISDWLIDLNLIDSTKFNSIWITDLTFHRLLCQDFSVVKLIAWLQSATPVFGSGWRNAELASWIFHNYIFFTMKLSSWRKTGLWNRTFSVSPGCEIQGRVIWQQSPASPAPGRDGSAQPGSCRTLGQWANTMWSSTARLQWPWKRQHECL